MLMRFDPFREFDRLSQDRWNVGQIAAMPMDAYREGDQFVVHFDLPGVDADSINLTVEQNVLTVSAERRWQHGDRIEVVASERPQGSFSRQLLLGDGLDADRVDAQYDDGVLTLTIPVADQAKPRKIEISAGDHKARAIETAAAEASSS